jgi:hypothetical protein
MDPILLINMVVPLGYIFFHLIDKNVQTEILNFAHSSSFAMKFNESYLSAAIESVMVENKFNVFDDGI